MNSLISERIPYSPLRKMFDAAQALEKTGRKMIHMELGRPDFRTPDHIVEAAIQALKDGKHHYCPNAGIPQLREAISRKYSTEMGLDYSPQSETLVTNGVAEGIFLAIKSLLNPGDQILVPNPVWLNYNVVPLMAYVEPVSYSLKEENGFQIDPAELESLITPRTRMLAIVSPSNPTGASLTPKTLQAIAEIADKHDLIVISDEIYEKIVYAPAVFTSITSLPSMKDRTIILNGFSKYYSMTGWRLGYAVGPQKYINAMLRYHQYALTSVSTFSQYGALAALTGDNTPSEHMVKEFQKRRDFFYTKISQIKGFRCACPDSAFYLFPSIKDTGLSGQEMAQMLLEKANVVSVPGEAFGNGGIGYLRFSYACSMEDLEIAAHNITDCINSL